MFGASAKMSLEASDVQTDEDFEELVEDGFSFSADFLEKKTRRKRSSSKPPPSPRSPYLSSMNVNPRRAAVAAWRLPRASLGDTRGDTRGDTPGDGGSARITSLSNGHDVSQTLRSEYDATPELLRQTLSMKKHKNLLSGSNGITHSTGDYRDKEDMYDEIIRLKKTLQAHKSDNQKMKAKLRRLEEDNAKREKQIEELLAPTKGSDYTRSLVDKKKEGSVVINGLKQRILKLEQQCREKENALSKLQSELRTTNLEELKITVETYFDETKERKRRKLLHLRLYPELRILLEAAEKSSRTESKCSQRQQKVLSSTVHRLSENLKQLQQENTALREELDTDSPAGGIKGYREWSKQRLLRRLLEVEKRLEDSRKAVVSVGTSTEAGEEVSEMRERLGQSEKEQAELQERLSNKDDELRQEELDQLLARIQTLEDRSKAAAEEPPSLSDTSPEHHEDSEAGAAVEERGDGDTGGAEEKQVGREEDMCREEEEKEREKATLVIQTHWREHRNRDTAMLQSALRGHLCREKQLKDLLKDAQKKATNRSYAASSVEGELDVVALTMVQSAFRGHLARCSHAIESSEVSVPSPMGNNLPTMVPRKARSTHKASRTGAASPHEHDEKQEEDPWLSSTHSSRMTPTAELHFPAESAAVDSDDSDDIIVSPSRPMRSREVLML
ncbi:IQ domain containing protein E [Dissostichus eleginoides]|uniref:IQ domain containing protein E n=1 Tax=Dissostichus eleginoides TaxID=100907 RepID=A0AAD9BQC5_DISEL|nr:IQ domain containing protein E [Dissostichus eleginoides]